MFDLTKDFIKVRNLLLENGGIVVRMKSVNHKGFTVIVIENDVMEIAYEWLDIEELIDLDVIENSEDFVDFLSNDIISYIAYHKLPDKDGE